MKLISTSELLRQAAGTKQLNKNKFVLKCAFRNRTVYAENLNSTARLISTAKQRFLWLGSKVQCTAEKCGP